MILMVLKLISDHMNNYHSIST